MVVAVTATISEIVEQLEAKLETLDAKARAGSLSETEETGLDSFMQLGWLLDRLKSKARLVLGICQPRPSASSAVLLE